MVFKLGLKKPRINKLFLISLITSLIMVGIGGYHYKGQLDAAQETMQIAVPRYDLPRYHKITADDLTSKNIPVGTTGPDTLIDRNNIVDKYTKVTLYKGEYINQNRLTEINLLQSYDFVSVNVDLARAGGAMPGDRVDVYKLILDTDTGTTIKKPVAKDSIVLNVWDGQGNSIYSSQKNGITDKAVQALSNSKPPAVVRLAVKPAETGQVVDGATVGKTNIVLAVKNGESEGGVTTGNGDKKAAEPNQGTDTGRGKVKTDTGEAKNS